MAKKDIPLSSIIEKATNMDEHFKKVSNSVARLEAALCERSFDKAIKINLAAMRKWASRQKQF